MLDVGVHDRDPRLPARGRRGRFGQEAIDDNPLLAESGRGLRLIEALAAEWGATAMAVGKEVWFQLDLGDWPYGGRLPL